MKKPLACLWIAVCLMLCSVYCAAAEEAGFAFDPTTGAVTGWYGNQQQVVIPENIGGVPVTIIASDAFQGSSTLTQLTIPASVTLIQTNAFADCEQLAYLIFESGQLPEVEPGAFDGCSVADVDLPWNASRQQVAQAQTVLDTMGLGAKVWRGNAPGLELPCGDYQYESAGRSGYVFTAYEGTQQNLYLHYGLILEDGTTAPVYALGDSVFQDNMALKRFGVPHSDQFTTIGKEAFAGSGLEWIDLYDTVTEIGKSAFRDCNALGELVLPPSLRSVGADAFAGCTALHTLYLQCDTSILPKEAFCDCTSLTTVYLDSEKIRNGLFSGLPVSTVVFGQEVTTIGDNAFQGTGITELILPETIQKVGKNAFDDCLSLTSITILCDVSALPADAFANCPNLTQVHVAKGSVPAGFLEKSSITMLELGEAVTSIGRNAFANTALTGVVLPAAIRLEKGAFDGVAPENIRISDQADDAQIETLSAILNRPWYLPLLRESENSSMTAMPDLPESEGFVFDAQTGTILGYSGTDSTLIIPRQIDGIPVRSIAASAFMAEGKASEALRAVILPESVTLIGEEAFSGCSRLETVLCYGPLESIGAKAFQNCSTLSGAVFVNGVRQIDDHAFDGCTNLKTLWWNGTVDNVGTRAFASTALESFSLRIHTVGAYAFADCVSLREAHLCSGVQRMETYVFDGCVALESLCFEWNDDDVFAQFARIGQTGLQTQVILPAETSLKQLQGMFRILSQGNEGPVAHREDILLADCATQAQQPDIERLLEQCLP